jgi:hypothetical protein
MVERPHDENDRGGTVRLRQSASIGHGKRRDRGRRRRASSPRFLHQAGRDIHEMDFVPLLGEPQRIRSRRTTHIHDSSRRRGRTRFRISFVRSNSKRDEPTSRRDSSGYLA